MGVLTFDTLRYFEKLKSAGFTEEQAKVQVEAIHGVISGYDEATRKELATKGDLAETKHEILKWVIGIAFAQTAIIIAVVALGVGFIIKYLP